jgi:hypothetical protein
MQSSTVHRAMQSSSRWSTSTPNSTRCHHGLADLTALHRTNHPCRPCRPSTGIAARPCDATEGAQRLALGLTSTEH